MNTAKARAMGRRLAVSLENGNISFVLDEELKGLQGHELMLVFTRMMRYLVSKDQQMVIEALERRVGDLPEPKARLRVRGEPKDVG